MLKLEGQVLLSKFRGSLLGSLLGDCLGSPFEGDVISPGEKVVIQKYFDKLEDPNLKAPRRAYTDDTAMMKNVAKALVDKPEIDLVYMAKLFVKEYFAEPNRGYGENVVNVFKNLRKDKFGDIFRPAAEQFNGTGSYGNGGAMRIAPIALYYHDNYNNMLKVARECTQITHTNPLGVHGALLQCIAIRQALYSDPKNKPIDPEGFCNELSEKMQDIEKENDDGLDEDYPKPYQEKIDSMKRLLKTKYNDELDDEVILHLGNSLCALESVPTAIYCFLKSLGDEYPTVKTENVFRRTIQYAITLGGDTDTIACMAGAIAGAYTGEGCINQNIIKQCEFQEEILKLANDLHKAVCT